MADRFVYKGGTSVVENNSSGRIRFIQPKSGISKFPRWWNRRGNIYVDVALFRVELENGIVVRLVIPHQKGGMHVEVRHDGYGNFTFPKCRLERIAVVAADSPEVLVEYQFSKISGGSVLKRTLSGIPSPAPEPEPEVESFEPDLDGMTKQQLLAWALAKGHDLVDNQLKCQILTEFKAILEAD
jgi:hypothetical protein